MNQPPPHPLRSVHIAAPDQVQLVLSYDRGRGGGNQNTGGQKVVQAS